MLFTFLVETKAERDDSKKRFWKWFDSDSTKKDLGKYHPLIVTFWNTSLKPCESYWAADLFLEIPTLEVTTTNASEQMNSSTKCGFMATKSQSRIDRSCQTMMDKSNARSNQKLKKDSSMARKTILWSKTESKNTLTDYAEGLAVSMLDKQDNYAVVQLSSDKWWVYWVGPGEEPNDVNKQESVTYFYHPVYRRVRVVELFQLQFMKCTCNRSCQRLMTCEHILCIVGQSHPIMYHLWWWNPFQLYYMRDESMTEKFNNVLLKKYEGVSVKGLNICHKNGKHFFWIYYVFNLYMIFWYIHLFCSFLSYLNFIYMFGVYIFF